MIKNSISQLLAQKNYKSFGFLPDGKEVICYTICNKNGVELSIINYGAAITSLQIPISDDKKVDVVLGFETLEDYLNSYNLPSAPYFGAIIGRYSGRINNAEFMLNGKLISLNKNHGNHSLHGGKNCFSKNFWELKSITTGENPSITLAYTSVDNEENFPGELQTTVTYTVTEDNELIVSYSASATEDTIINLTQHSYFNLDGHENDVLSQKLHINSDTYLQTNQENVPTGDFINVKNSTFDFTIPKSCPEKIDTSFILDKKKECAATLFSTKNNLKMVVSTNKNSVHIYVGGNCFDQISGKQNANYHSKSGICFETQNFPDAPNHANFPNAILKKGEIYRQKTVFKFEKIIN